MSTSDADPADLLFGRGKHTTECHSSWSMCPFIMSKKSKDYLNTINSFKSFDRITVKYLNHIMRSDSFHSQTCPSSCG